MRPLATLLVVILCHLAGACGSQESLAQESPADIFMAVEFHGATCKITESVPAFEPSGTDGLNLLAAEADQTLTVVMTNTSELKVVVLVHVHDPDMTVLDVFARKQASPPDGFTYTKPSYMEDARIDYTADQLNLAENQQQTDWILQPGVHSVMVHTTVEIWRCRADSASVSLIDVPVD